MKESQHRGPCWPAPITLTRPLWLPVPGPQPRPKVAWTEANQPHSVTIEPPPYARIGVIFSRSRGWGHDGAKRAIRKFWNSLLARKLVGVLRKRNTPMTHTPLRLVKRPNVNKTQLRYEPWHWDMIMGGCVRGKSEFMWAPTVAGVHTVRLAAVA